MACNWKETCLGKLLKFSNGKTSSVKNNLNPYPVYGSNGIIGYSKESNAANGSIIIGRVGSYCGSVYFCHSKCWVTDNAIYARPIDNNDPKFLFYLLSCLKLNQWRVGSGQPLLNQAILNSITVEIPTPKIQQAIANVLGKLDDKMELNRQMNAILEQMAQAIFKSWFVDFDPVYAKSQGRKPVGMTDEIAALFPDSFKDSEFGMIPKGWRYSKLADCIKFVKGKKPENSIESSAFAPHLLIATFDGQSIEMVSTKNMVMAEPDDILMVMDGASSGRTEIGFSGVVGSTIAKIVTDQDFKYFLYYFLKQHEIEINSHTTGTSIPHADKELIFRLSFCFPTKQMLDTFNRQVISIREKIVLNKQESNSLSILRDTLLPKLLSGEMSIKTAEQQLSQAL